MKSFYFYKCLRDREDASEENIYLNILVIIIMMIRLD